MFDPSEVITHEDTKILARFFQSPITVASFRHSGLSRQGIAIKAKGQTFFIKQFDSELDESMLLEKRLSKLTSIKALSPKLVGHIERYLIYEYVDHTILGELTLSLEEKIGVTCKVLTQFQQAIRIELPKLDVKKATLDLLAQCSLHDKTVELIIEYIESLVLPVSNKLDVICHGDLNFANIIKPVG